MFHGQANTDRQTDRQPDKPTVGQVQRDSDIWVYLWLS